jgi:uncharacterized protein YecE (DUF72 family)
MLALRLGRARRRQARGFHIRAFLSSKRRERWPKGALDAIAPLKTDHRTEIRAAEAVGLRQRRGFPWSRGDESQDAERVMGPMKPRKSGWEVFVYFDNDAKVRAPVDAKGLARRLDIRWGAAASTRPQRTASRQALSFG